MPSRLILHVALSAVLIGMLISGTASARIVYRCTNAHGDVSLQDPPCAKGDRQTMIPVEDDPAQAAPVATTPVEPIAVAPPAVKPPPAPVAPVVAPPPRRPLPALWLCTRPEDGSHYITHDGSAPSRLVPAGILGIPGKSLAQTYGPGDGGGVSAPGVNKAPVSAAQQDSVAAGFVEVHDDCAPSRSRADLRLSAQRTR